MYRYHVARMKSTDKNKAEFESSKNLCFSLGCPGAGTAWSHSCVDAVVQKETIFRSLQESWFEKSSGRRDKIF